MGDAMEWNEKEHKSVQINTKNSVTIPNHTLMICSKSKLDPPVLNHPLMISTKETVNVTLKHDGSVGNFELLGKLYLHIINQEDGYCQFQIESGGDPRIRYDTPHSSVMNIELYSHAKFLTLLENLEPWPASRSETVGTPIFKWRMPSAAADDDESLVPLKIRCLHSVSGNETYVNLQYEASKMFQPLQDIVIAIPIPAFQEVRSVYVRKFVYYFTKRVLEGSIKRIDDSNCSGSLAFGIPVETDIIEFSPISGHFTYMRTFSDAKVVNVLPLRANDPPQLSQRKQPTRFTESFQLV